MTNCRNCGMPLTGSVCEYCGTKYDILDAEVKPLHIYKPGLTKQMMLAMANEEWERRENEREKATQGTKDTRKAYLH